VGLAGFFLFWAALFLWVGPFNSSFSIVMFIQLFKPNKFAKYETGTSGAQKISKLCVAEDKFKRNSFPFGKKSKFLTEF
jgi:hypothetical protein